MEAKMKVFLAVIFCGLLVIAQGTPSRRTAKAIVLRDRLLTALCSLKGEVTESCLTDGRLRKAVQNMIDMAADGKESLQMADLSGKTNRHYDDKRRRQSNNFYSNWK